MSFTRRGGVKLLVVEIPSWLSTVDLWLLNFLKTEMASSVLREGNPYTKPHHKEFIF